MGAIEKVNTSLLLGALGFSILVHVVLFISVMNIEIPKETTRADFEAWVKDIAPRKREAIILPEAPVKSQPMEQPGKEKAAATGSKTAKASGSTKAAASPARTKALRSAGILALIGVASDRSSGSKGKGAIADVFSSDSGKVSDDLGAVMEGKQRAELATGSHISRQASGPADIGGIASNSSGKVATGQRQASELPVARVQTKTSGVVSGNADSQSVLSVIARKNSSFTRCYERALKNNPELTGKLAYELSVSEEGQVLGVKFTEDTLRVKDVADCIKGILLRLVFPAPKGGPAIFGSVLVFGTT